jgi:hypothetical protein
VPPEKNRRKKRCGSLPAVGARSPRTRYNIDLTNFRRNYMNITITKETFIALALGLVLGIGGSQFMASKFTSQSAAPVLNTEATEDIEAIGTRALKAKCRHASGYEHCHSTSTCPANETQVGTC